MGFENKYVNLIIGMVIVLAVLSAVWGSITEFVAVLTNGTGAEASLGGLIPMFLILAVVLGLIAVALGKRQ